MVKRKVWWWIRSIIRKVVYGTAGGIDDPMIPQFGKGKFVSVYLRRKCLEFINTHEEGVAPTGRIRLVPYQPNHGVMVEFYDDKGKMRWRTHCSYDAFYRMGASGTERSE